MTAQRSDGLAAEDLTKPERAIRRHRVLLVVQRYPDGGGISGIVEMLIPELSEIVDVHLAVVELGQDVPQRVRLEPMRVHRLAVHPLCKPMLFPTSIGHAASTTRHLRHLVAEVKPSLMLAQDAVHVGPATVLAGRLSGVPTAVMDHGTLTNLYDARFPATCKPGMSRLKRLIFDVTFSANRPVRAMAWRAAVKQADRAWRVGNELAPFFSAAGPRERRYRQLVPEDFSRLSPAARAAARRRFDIPQGARAGNIVSRLDPEKGLFEIAQAFARVLPQHPDAFFVVAGTGRLEDDFRRWVRDAGCQDAVRFVGHLSRQDVRMLHLASDIHLYAGTLGCAVSVAMLEAMQAGVIPVVSDVPSFHRELIRRSGFVFRAGDVDDLESALDQALSLTPEQLEARIEALQDDLDGWDDPTLVQLVAELLPHAT